MSDPFRDAADAITRRDSIRRDARLAREAHAALTRVLDQAEAEAPNITQSPVYRGLYRQRAILAARLNRDATAGRRFAELAHPNVVNALQGAEIDADQLGAWIHACAATTTLGADVRAALEALEIEGTQPE